MEFHVKKKESPNGGDKRVVKKFALFPIRIGYTIKWLEIVTIEQCFEYGSTVDSNGDGYWANMRFK